MTERFCRWGILGTANIARKNWKALHNAGNCTLVAVASRDRGRAQRFIDDCQASVAWSSPPAACGSYDELLGRRDIDAVYIPLPTGIRKDWVIRAAQAGKHILCEKPCAVSSPDLREMLDVCRKQRVQFMDGVMFMHSRRLPLLRQVLDDGQSVGPIRRIASQFSFKAAEEFYQQNIRSSGVLEPLGCLGDLGWYNIRFSLWVMNQQLPERVTGRFLTQHARDGAAAVPVEFCGVLSYPDGVSASFYCSFRAENNQWATVSGTQGYLTVADFVVPFYGCESGFDLNQPVFRVRGCDFNMESHPRRFAVAEYSSGGPGSQETSMMRTFADLVIGGRLEPEWGEMALKTQEVVDACLRSAEADGQAVRLKARPN